MRITRLITALTVAALIVPPIPSSATRSPAADNPARSTTLTLVTGDRVIVNHRPGRPDEVAFRPTPGSGSRGAITARTPDRTIVVPHAALADLTAGRLDPALFDVSGLLAKRSGRSPVDARPATGPHQVRLDLINPDGTPGAGMVIVSRPDGGDGGAGPLFVDGTTTVELPTGTYDVAGVLVQDLTDEKLGTTTLAAHPDLEVTGDRTITLDGRTAKPVTIGVRGHDEFEAEVVGTTYSRFGADGSLLTEFSAGAFPAVSRSLVTPTPAARFGSLEFSVGGRLQVPVYRAWSLGPGGAEIPVLPYIRGPRFTGTRSHLVANGGAAGPGELSGVRGKLAVVRRTADRTIGEQVRAAQAAGAAAVLAYDLASPYFGVELFEPAGATIPAMVARRSEAERLLALARTRPVPVRIEGIEADRVVYDLLRPHAGRVPVDPALRPAQSEFAPVDESFGAPADGARITAYRWGATAKGRSVAGLIGLPEQTTPARRRSYVLAGPVTWTPHVVVENLDLDSEWFGEERTYAIGQRSTERWFAPVVNSGLPDRDAYLGGLFRPGVRQRSDFGVLLADLSPFRHPGQWESISNAGSYRMALSRDGAEVATADSPFLVFPTEPQAAEYQLNLEAERDTPWWSRSTRIRSDWTFRSAGAADEVMPLVLADLDVPGASSRGEVRAGTPVRINLGLRHQYGAKAAPFTSARLETSDNGKDWTELKLNPSGAGHFTATVTHPASAAGRPVHLRLDARDADGGRLVQEITRAYLLAP